MVRQSKGCVYTMKKTDSPTMKDVAREAGVALGTVSKVINGIPVGESYRQRVEDAIEKLGYRVNSYARGLKTNKTNCVALLMPSLRHPFFAILTDELTACLMKHGYRSLLMITNYDPMAEEKCFAMVRSNKADGAIALTYSPDLTVSGKIPLVTIDRHLGDDVPCVSSDNYRGGELAAKKLIGLGCRSLLHLRVTSGVPGEPDKRGAGFEFKCAAAGVPCRTIILSDRESDLPLFRFVEEHLCNGQPEYDGIFCGSDLLACQILRFLHDHGVSVPEQVQIIGYDGIPDRMTGSVSCSTIEQPIAHMAEASVDLILNFNNTSVGANICLPVKYVPGGTTRDEPQASTE